jgi:putative toxin-antitoxin system antitoxin component (TIGR02293 family)
MLLAISMPSNPCALPSEFVVRLLRFVLVLHSSIAAMWHQNLDILAALEYSGWDMKHVLRSRQVTPRRSSHVRPDKRYASLGASLGLLEKQIDALIEHLQRGLSFKALESFSSESGLAVPEIASLIGVPERTLARRRVVGKLSPDESERLLRLSGGFERAVGLFEGNVPAAIGWLRRPNKALGSKSPLTYLRTEIGARKVEDLIGEMEHGVFA